MLGASSESPAERPEPGYALVAQVLARAAEHDPSGGVQRVVQVAATQAGREIAAAGGGSDLLDVLRDQGYERYDDDGVIRLRNCPPPGRCCVALQSG